MRVLNVMMGKRRGGLEHAAIDLHEELTLAGCDVVSLVQPTAAVRPLFPESARVVTFRDLGAWDFTGPARVRARLAGEAFDVIVAHGNRAVRVAGALRRRTPVIAICHTTNFSILKRLGSIDGAIALTDAYREVLLRAGYPAARIRRVPNAVRLGEEPEAVPPRDTPLIGALGRLAPNKGFDVLLAAAALLKQRGVSFRIVIHGADASGGASAEEARRDALGLSRAEFDFAGWTDAPEGFLRSLDVFCLPSRREVFSIALLQALAAGRPIVATRIPGVDEAISDGVEGVVVASEDPVALADALERLIRDPELRRRMGAAARRRAARFDLPAVGKELRRALAELAEQPTLSASS
jgi:glycosyltransferase involved in cell wall biosynthesis